MKEQFKIIRFGPVRAAFIRKVNEVIHQIQAMGYTLTLRQLYYQLVGADIIANKQTEYKRLGDILNDARLAGLVDWDSIEDRTRNLCGVSHWDKPENVIESAANSYRIDKWNRQKYHVEVWVEKDALVGVLEKACRPLDVNWFSCRGYTSQSELYTAGKRLKWHGQRGRQPVIIHLGDHDPSGLDMTRDITSRVEMFAERGIIVRRIALNMDQVDEHHLPPNPAKVTDSRYAGYAEEYGEESWELDALHMRVLDKLITATVKEFRNDEIWHEDVAKEARERAALAEASKKWKDLVAHLNEIRTRDEEEELERSLEASDEPDELEDQNEEE